MANLGDDLLFVNQPLDSFDQFNLYDLYYDINDGNFDAAITKTYTLIKLDIFNQVQKLKLWEIRLLLMIFTNQVDEARTEAINVNNCLYLVENESPKAEVYPLPKLNDNIPVSLLYLLAKLKNLPNIYLINELYKLTYQLRLKSNDLQNLRTYLQNFSYHILLILIITKNNCNTGLSYIKSLYQQVNSTYKSNLGLMIMLTEFKLMNQYQLLLLEDFTIDSLKFVVNEPSIDLQNFKDFINIDNIDKIIIDLASIWQLNCQYGFYFSSKDGVMSFTNNQEHVDIENTIDTDKTIDRSLDMLNKSWCNHVDKVFLIQ